MVRRSAVAGSTSPGQSSLKSLTLPKLKDLPIQEKIKDATTVTRKVTLRATAPRETREGPEDQEVALDLDPMIVVMIAVEEETAIVTEATTIVTNVTIVAETEK